MKDTSTRLHFTLPIPLLEKVRKEAYEKKMTKGKIVRLSLEERYAKKK